MSGDTLAARAFFEARSTIRIIGDQAGAAPSQFALMIKITRAQWGTI